MIFTGPYLNKNELSVWNKCGHCLPCAFSSTVLMF